MPFRAMHPPAKTNAVENQFLQSTTRPSHRDSPKGSRDSFQCIVNPYHQVDHPVDGLTSLPNKSKYRHGKSSSVVQSKL